ncbi:MAG: ATP-binding cassette domain-containing protein [Candidatus Nitrosopolaris sp.]|jgi:NitT/TauT family transport system ATP-binding protein
MNFLEMMQLKKFADVFTYQLSDGMKQRVAIARALVTDSEVLLMDEPFAALDSRTRDLLMVELQLIWAGTKKTIVFVTHSITKSVCLGDKVVVFTNRPGKVKKGNNHRTRKNKVKRTKQLYRYQSKILDELVLEINTTRKVEVAV